MVLPVQEPSSSNHHRSSSSDEPSFIITNTEEAYQEHFHFFDELSPSPLHFMHSGRVNQVFSPMRFILLSVGRFPFTLVKVPKESFLLANRKIKDIPGDKRNDFVIQSKELNHYSASLKSPFWLYFGCTSFALTFIFVLFTGGFLDVFLGWSFIAIQPWDVTHKAIFHSNLIPFVLVWSCLLHSVVGSVSFFLNRRTLVKFLNYWNVAVDRIMAIDEAPCTTSLKRFILASNLWFFGFLILTIVSYKILKIQIVRGGSGLLGLLVLRVWYPNAKETDETFWKFRMFGLFVMMYSMYASRALLFLFAFKCRLLRQCFRDWNLKLFKELGKTKLADLEGLRGQKSSCSKLFQSHVILLKLVKLTDKSFAAILLSYYGSQILNMCFELYYLAMSGTLEIFNSDGIDTFVAILLLLQNIYVFLTVSLHAAYVGEEANKGFDIVKSRGIRVDDNLYIRCLIRSLQISYLQKIQLTGGNYFAIDKPFIVTVLGAVFTYFIIILQYGHKISPVLTDSYNGTALSGVIH